MTTAEVGAAGEAAIVITAGQPIVLAAAAA